ncbi:MAG: RNA methyltransferase [Alcanivoracaceae bacterium]
MANSTTVFIGLVDPKSPSNVGSVMRAAGCYQVDQVRYSGGRFERAAQYQTDTKDILSKIPLVREDQLLQGLPGNMKIVCVELAEGASPLPQFVHPDQAIYVFGPEDGSIPQALIDEADHVVYVPTVGCMNLAAAVNVLLYDRLAKSAADIHGNDLIKGIRDTNNRLKVRKLSR